MKEHSCDLNAIELSAIVERSFEECRAMGVEVEGDHSEGLEIIKELGCEADILLCNCVDEAALSCSELSGEYLVVRGEDFIHILMQ